MKRIMMKISRCPPAWTILWSSVDTVARRQAWKRGAAASRFWDAVWIVHLLCRFSRPQRLLVPCCAAGSWNGLKFLLVIMRFKCVLPFTMRWGDLNPFLFYGAGCLGCSRWVWHLMGYIKTLWLSKIPSKLSQNGLAFTDFIQSWCFFAVLIKLNIWLGLIHLRTQVTLLVCSHREVW